MNRILVIHKKRGMTSRDVVNVVSKKLGIKKAGHTGTLDPMAEGVLIVLTGRYTKLNELLMATEKEYIATVKMGLLTDTLDLEGTVLKEDFQVATKEQLELLFQTFPRTYNQEVPLYSAVKIGGKKLYEYARKNEEVPLPKRKVQLFELELLEVGEDTFTFRAVVSKGTYIRSLVRDLGKALDLSFTLTSLIRTRQGTISLEEAIFLEDVTENVMGYPLEKALSLPSEVVDGATLLAIRNGQKVPNQKKYERILFLSPSKMPLAIYKQDGPLLRVDKMLGGNLDETTC